ncbi:MAG: transposase [Candidatus Paceibacterota bacterium]
MELYHVLNRGVDGRKLFLDSQDYVRFIHNLFEFNDSAPSVGSARRDICDTNVGPRRSYIRKRLVEIHGWVLMKDHYHLIISELIEGGLLKFMMKVNVGYAKYYNERYTRHGHLFQGKTKKIRIERAAHFLYILHYVHLNPLDYLRGAATWRERDKNTIKNTREALKYLDEYRWSSYLDYCSKKNFPSILTKRIFGNVFGNYQEVIKDYLKNVEESPIGDSTILE